MIEDLVNAQMQFLLVQLGGKDMSRFDQTLTGSLFVQSRLYMNVEYFTQNLAAVAPFDPASIGVPAHLVKKINHPSFGQYLMIGPRFFALYRLITNIYKNILPSLDKELSVLYWKIRAANDIETIWAVFDPDLHERLRNIERAHAVNALMVVSIDSILRQYAPDLLMLFAGRMTATSQIGQDIWTLRQTAARCGAETCRLLQKGETNLEAYRALPEASPLLQEIDSFMRKYGHRGFRFEYDFETERMADHPEHILLTIGSQLSEKEAPEKRAQAAREAAMNSLQKLNPAARLLWKNVIQWSQNLIAWRETSKSIWSLRQAIYGLAARKMAQQFYPDQPDDILLFYTFKELTTFAASKGEKRIENEILETRRQQHTLHQNQPPPPELIWYNTESHKWVPALETETVSQEIVKQLRGYPASIGSGPVEGYALVTNDPMEAARRLLELKTPTILITRLTDPAWSTLFGRLTAAVTELGGVISHAAIVARENGLPSVVGVSNATHYIRDGQRLRVDGATGIIDILD